MTRQMEKTRWGRAKFGGSQSLLLTVSLGSGALAATGFALILYTVQGGGDLWVYLLASFATVFFAASALLWVLLVDHNTLQGAVKSPENSVENTWYDRAAVTTFHIMFPVLGVGAGISTIFSWTLPLGTGLMLAAVLMMLTFAVSYQIHKRR